MKTINYESDFPLSIKPKEIESMSGQPFELVFYTKKAIRTYIAKYDGNEYTNCRPTEDGGVVVFFDNHKLGIGTLWVDVHVPLTDKDFVDGVCNYRSTEPTGIVLDKGATDDLGGFCVDVFPFFKQGEDGKSAYDLWLEEGNEGTVADFLNSMRGEPFTYDDFTPEQLEALKGPKGDTFTYDDLTQEQKEDLAYQVIGEAENERRAAELVRQENESKREAQEDVRTETFAANEGSREQAFNTAQNNRNTEFQKAETNRSNTFSANEVSRQQSFEANESARQSTFSANEAERQVSESTRVTAEGARESAEALRKQAEEARENTFATNEKSRQDTFAANESDRQAEFVSNEAIREAEFGEAIQAAKDNLVVVNDLTTGGTDKALSAEMGKVLGGGLDGLEREVVGMPDATLVWQAEGFYILSATEGVSVSTVVYENSGYRCLMVACKEGDKFVFTGRGSAQRAYAFLDKDYTMLGVYGDIETKYKNELLTAPSGSAYAILQTNAAEWAELGSALPVQLGTEGLKDVVEGKQDALVSGENIKTINGVSILGGGDIEIRVDGSLSERVETIEGDLYGKEETTYEWELEGYYYTDLASASVGSVVDLSKTSQGYNERAVIVPCKGGEKFEIHLRSNAVVPYAFLDGDGRVLECGAKGKRYIGTILTAPSGSTKVVFSATNSEWAELGSNPPKRFATEGLDNAMAAILYDEQELSSAQAEQVYENLHADAVVLNNVFKYGGFADASMWEKDSTTSNVEIAFGNSVKITSTAFYGNSVASLKCKNTEDLSFGANKKVFFSIVCRSSLSSIPLIKKNSQIGYANIEFTEHVYVGMDYHVYTLEYITSEAEAFSVFFIALRNKAGDMPVGSYHEINALYVGVYDADSDMTAARYGELVQMHGDWFVGYVTIPSGRLLEGLQTSLYKDKVVTVGDGGDFPTIGMALEYMSQFYPAYRYGGVKAEIRILNDTTITDQVLVVGADYSWITITYEGYNPDGLTYDNVAESIANGTIVFGQTSGYNAVRVDASAWTEVTHDTRGDVVLFRAEDGGRLPAIGCVFELAVAPSDERYGAAGVVCNRGSSCVVKTLCGFIGFKDGVIANNESSITIREGITMNCSRWGCHARHNGEVSARSVIATGCATLDSGESGALYSDRIADLDGREAWVSSGVCAFRCQNASRMNCNGTHIIGDESLTTELVSNLGSVGNFSQLQYVGILKLNNSEGGIIIASSGYTTDTTYKFNIVSRAGVIYG